MQIQILKERINVLPENQILNMLEILEGVEIKLYLSTIEKRIIVDNIINGCIEIDENSIMKVNFFNKKLISDISLITNYTNLIFSDDNSIEDYDFLSQYKILNHIIKHIDSDELDFIYNMVEDELEQQIIIGNSLESVIAKGLNKLIDKIPDEKSMNKLINNLPKVLNKIKPENLEILKQFVNQQQQEKFFEVEKQKVVKEMGKENKQEQNRMDEVVSKIEITE